MIKNILILSSNNTGHGHKSITESLLEQFSHYPDVNVHVMTVYPGRKFWP